MHRVKNRDLRLGTDPHTLGLLAGMDDDDARLGATAGGEGDGDEPQACVRESRRGGGGGRETK
jgi:hypothetical protein